MFRIESTQKNIPINERKWESNPHKFPSFLMGVFSVTPFLELNNYFFKYKKICDLKTILIST